MYSYLLIDFFVISVPFILFATDLFGFRRYGPAFLISILCVGLPFLLWDLWMTSNGVWGFSSRYITGVKLLVLPIEEVLFFVCVPFSCIVIYELFLYKMKEKKVDINTNYIITVSLFIGIFSLFFIAQRYTFSVLIGFSVTLTLCMLINKELLQTKTFWASIIFCYFPFLIVNTILTAPPIVYYNSADIWNLRIITIPLEDAFYCFALLGPNIAIYDLVKKKLLN